MIFCAKCLAPVDDGASCATCGQTMRVGAVQESASSALASSGYVHRSVGSSMATEQVTEPAAIPAARRSQEDDERPAVHSPDPLDESANPGADRPAEHSDPVEPPAQPVPRANPVANPRRTRALLTGVGAVGAAVVVVAVGAVALQAHRGGPSSTAQSVAQSAAPTHDVSLQLELSPTACATHAVSAASRVVLASTAGGLLGSGWPAESASKSCVFSVAMANVPEADSYIVKSDGHEIGSLPMTSLRSGAWHAVLAVR